jgi:hypothetical protein
MTPTIVIIICATVVLTAAFVFAALRDSDTVP